MPTLNITKNNLVSINLPLMYGKTSANKNIVLLLNSKLLLIFAVHTTSIGEKKAGGIVYESLVYRQKNLCRS